MSWYILLLYICICPTCVESRVHVPVLFVISTYLHSMFFLGTWHRVLHTGTWYHVPFFEEGQQPSIRNHMCQEMRRGQVPLQIQLYRTRYKSTWHLVPRTWRYFRVRSTGTWYLVLQVSVAGKYLVPATLMPQKVPLIMSDRLTRTSFSLFLVVSALFILP